MKLFKSKISILFVLLTVTMFALIGCSNSNDQNSQEPTGTEETKLSGEIKVDGSSTVFPITEAVAEEFSLTNPDVKVPVGVSGTGGGFEKFIAKETDISDASRPIKEKEAAEAKAAGVEYIELTVAYDGLSVLVNPDNTWVDSLTVEELKMIWEPDSTVKTWSDVRPEWPEEEIKFYAPGTDSGTFDYFTEEINGESGAIRPDFTGSEDDNVLVQGIAGDKNALGFFGYAYYEGNKDKLKIVPIDNGNGPVTPNFDTIKDGSYSPLSRPLFIYVNKESLNRPEVKEFVTFYLDIAKYIIPDVGYVALPDEEYTKGLDLIK
ncbi:MAG: PstS family phosphate ABC transporter substrate-binding protein [Sedimentibacter sp.]